jgi:hypothetical protein
VWAGLGSTSAIEHLRAYLDEFPKGANSGAARARIAALEREAAEARAAEQQRARENAEWGAVAASTDRGAIEAFLERWPNGQYAEAAQARIAASKGKVKVVGSGQWFLFYIAQIAVFIDNREVCRMKKLSDQLTVEVEPGSHTIFATWVGTDVFKRSNTITFDLNPRQIQSFSLSTSRLTGALFLEPRAE